MKQSKKATVIFIILTVILLSWVLFPGFWMLSTSFKKLTDVYSHPPVFVPKVFTFEGYIKLLLSKSRSFNFTAWAFNSFFTAITTTLFSMIIATFSGYGLSRFRFIGKKPLMYSVLATQVLPGSLLIVPLYTIINGFGMMNNLFGLVLANVTFAVPFCTWTMKGFFDSIPISIDEAARVDGAGKLKTFYKVITPLTIPGLIATGIFSFITGWNEYLFASVFMRSYDKWTLPVGISSFQGQYSTDWPTIMAGAVFITVPIVLLFLFLQKYLVSGLTAGAVKQ